MAQAIYDLFASFMILTVVGSMYGWTRYRQHVWAEGWIIGFAVGGLVVLMVL